MKLPTMFATILVLGSFLVAGCAGNQPAAPTGTKVTMGNLDYQPAQVSVKTGGSVIWENGSPVTHTVTFDDASMSAKSSGQMNKAAKHTVTFDTAGTYAYHCEIPGHATKGSDGKWTGMVGTVTVTA